MTTAEVCPESTNWSSALAAGYTFDTAAWITAKKNECYGNPVSNPSLSKVHTFIRQLRVVVLTLREHLCKINEEIKLVLKIREGVARSLDDLQVELKAKKTEATIKRPRFIKNRARDALVELWQRSSDNVKMNRPQMLSAQKKLRAQFTIVKEQLQRLAKTRKKVLSVILERTRVLDLFPEAIAASMKSRRDRIENEKLKNHQMAMIEEADHQSSLYRQYFGKAISPKLLEQVMKIKFNEPIHSSSSYTNLSNYNRRYLRKEKPKKSTKETPKDFKPKFGIAHENSETQLKSSAQKNANQTPCSCEDEPQSLHAMTPECTEAIHEINEALIRSRANRRKILTMVEDCFLVQQIPVKVQKPKREFGKYYGVACGGRCPRKHVNFYE